MLREQVLVTCEHASNRLPADLTLDRRLLDLHIAWDPGALVIAERMARRWRVPVLSGEFSRLVVDLNRSIGNRMLIRRVSDGHRIPFNYGLSAVDQQARIDRYYRPYRDAVAAAAEQIVARHGRCVHVCVHTFTAALAGNERANDIGLLHDPQWGVERAVCAEIKACLERRADLVAWYNRPYSGTADGILPAMRQAHSPERLVGIELEVNQRHAGDRTRLHRIADVVVDALEDSTALSS
ncbi:MAG TPA: N-formylglutamate amidohydrolase [Acidobacteriota bacterium]|nr:N-formylglutamate amidohydrolase [Acidobacteriota bacterium]